MREGGSERIALNFLPLTDSRFPFVVYRREFVEGDTRTDFPDCRLRKLPAKGSEEYRSWWVSPEPFDGAERYEASSGTNHLVAQDVLNAALHRRMLDVFGKEFVVQERGILGRQAIVLADHPEGLETVWLRPFRLRSTRSLGFLLDYWFKTPPGSSTNRRVLQLSLTLDAQGRRNRNFYLDRYRKVRSFIDDLIPRLFPLPVGGVEIDVARDLESLPLSRVAPPTFLFKGDRTADGPFAGVQRFGPIKPIQGPFRIYFLYKEADRPLSQDLFRALRGDSFGTFRGMEAVFGVPLDREHVGGIPLTDYSADAIGPALDEINRRDKEGAILPVVLVPFRRGDADPQSRVAYYGIKHAFLSAGLPSQFVSIEQLSDRNALKWSISNIALQMFAKLGGQPWRVDTTEEPALIVGLGQSTQRGETGVDRYLAYSVLTDSSGVYRELRFLGASHDEGDYRARIREGLLRLFAEYGEEYRRIVVHTSFSIRWREIEALEDAIAEAGTAHEVFVLRFNAGNRYFGWDLDSNSMVPFQGSVCSLSRDEHLIWFDGVNPDRPKVLGKTDRPVHVRFSHPRDGLGSEERQDLLTNAIRLAGANWRGFNARSLPVSVSYAHLVAEFLRGFADAGLGEPERLPATPWFL